MEIWKDIVIGGKGYQISDLGNIRRPESFYKTLFRGRQIQRHLPAKQYAFYKKSTKGYCRINLGGKVELVHRMVAIAFIENPNGLPQVNHKNGCKTDNRVENLEWVTNFANRRHAVINGLHATGPKPAARKYSDRDVDKMRRMLANGATLRSIGREFGTSHAAIRKALNRAR